MPLKRRVVQGARAGFYVGISPAVLLLALAAGVVIIAHLETVSRDEISPRAQIAAMMLVYALFLAILGGILGAVIGSAGGAVYGVKENISSYLFSKPPELPVPPELRNMLDLLDSKIPDADDAIETSTDFDNSFGYNFPPR